MSLWSNRKKTEMPAPDNALPGRDEPVTVSGMHFVNGSSYLPPFPDQAEVAVFGMGCFWGAERIFWQIPGVITTAVGYSGGYSKNPSYEEVCTGRTGHNEVALVVFDPSVVELRDVAQGILGEPRPDPGHAPRQRRRHPIPLGIYVTNDEQRDVAKRSLDRYQADLTANGFGTITTEIDDAGEFYYGEEYHQQYLAKNPGGYCNHGFCQVSYGSTPTS